MRIINRIRVGSLVEHDALLAWEGMLLHQSLALLRLRRETEGRHEILVAQPPVADAAVAHEHRCP